MSAGVAPPAHVRGARGGRAGVPLERDRSDGEQVAAARSRAVGRAAGHAGGRAQIECGDLVEPVKQGVIRWEDVRDLGDVIAGKAPGRPEPRAVTLFESQGLAMQDVVAGGVLERARRQAVGREIDFGGGNA